MKKLVIHSNTLWSIINFRSSLIRDLVKEGYQVICLAPRDNISESSDDRIKELDVQFIPIHIDRSGTNPIRDLAYFLRLVRILRKMKPDLVFTFTPKPNIYCSMACQVLRIPYVNTINGMGTGFSLGRLAVSLIKMLYKLALRKSSKVFFHNHDDLNFFVESGLSKPKKSSFMPGSGIDPDEYQCKKKRNPSPEQLTFLFVGRLNKEKGVFDFVYVAEKIKERFPLMQFWVVGFIDEGNPSSISQSELYRLSSTGIIEYKGKSDDIQEHLCAADIIILPSEYKEGLPRTLLEAASCEMPIITYDVPGCREVVKHGVNGFLVPQGDRDQLLAVTESFIHKTSSEISQLGINGRHMVIDKFSAKRVNELYFSSLNQH